MISESEKGNYKTSCMKIMTVITEILNYIKMLKPAGWLKAVIYTFIILAAYFSTVKYLILHDWALEDYSHCFLIPFVFLYLLWEKRQQLLVTSSVVSWTGFIPLLFGLCLFWLGELGGEFFTLYISLWLVFIGLLWIHQGWEKIKIMAFPLFMLLAMFPFPNFINNRLLLKLKLISSQIGVVLLQLYGMSAYREGNVIDLGFTQLQVVDACSGLRYVLPLLFLSLLLAYWFKAALWKRIVLVISSVPLAIFVNSIRIAVTGILYRYIGAQAAEGFFHDFSGWLIFILVLGVLLIEMWILKKIPGSRGRAQSEEDGAKGRDIEDPALDSRLRGNDEKNGNDKKGVNDEEGGNEKKGGNTIKSENEINSVSGIKSESDGKSGNADERWRRILLQPQFLVAAALLAISLLLFHSIEFREKIPSVKPFSQFPLAVSSWQGTRQFMGQEYIKELDLNDYTIIDFRNGDRHVDFYVAYYQTQRKNESIHSPETCLPAGGWIFHEAGKAKIRITGQNKIIEVSRAIMQKNDVQQVSYFWFPMRGRILTSLWQAKIYTFWDALTRQRTDGALVRIITPVYPQESVQDAEARLQKFTGEVIPVLDQFLMK